MEQHLAEAQRRAKNGQLLEARRILDSVVSLYAANQELRPLVERARDQIRQLSGSGAE